MTPQDAIRRMCRLRERVARDVFAWRSAADCFCGDNKIAVGWARDGYWRDDEAVAAFIEAAVEEKLRRDKVTTAPEEA